MVEFMLSETYLSEVRGLCSGAEARRVAYHARAIYREMEQYPQLRKLWVSSHKGFERYTELSVAWEVMIHDFTAIKQRCDELNYRSSAGYWDRSVIKLIDQLLRSQEQLEAEMQEEPMAFDPEDLDEEDDACF